MRDQGFWYWWMRNDLEPLNTGALSVADEEETVEETNDSRQPDNRISDRQDATQMFDALSKDQADRSN